jgi:excinuclease ABC subunit A
MDLVKCADHIIDLGIEGGIRVGEVIAQGTPEEVAKNKKSITAPYLREKI